jgi:lysophospholipase L1-like esterase
MKRCFKWCLILGVPLLLIIVLFGLYVAVVAGVDIPGLDNAFRADPQPPSPEALARAQAVEDRIDQAVSDKSGFYLELTDEDITALLLREIGPDINLRDVKAEIKRGNEVSLSASLNGRVGLPISGAVGVTLQQGIVQLEVKKVSFTALPLPGAAKDEVGSLVEDVLDVNELLSRAGATLVQDLIFEDGKVAIIGVQRSGESVSQVTRESLLQAAGGLGSRTPPTPPGGDVVPPGTASSKAGAGLYLALGDSLAANVGVGDPREGYVSRFHRYLEENTGQSLGLMDLGISGESSLSIYRSGQLDQALQELRRRKADPNSRVSVLTIDLGANDLIAHVNSPECMQDPRGEVCQRRVNTALDSFESNFRPILELLREELEPGAEFYVMTAYNPFSIGLGIPIEEFSNEVMGRLNEVIRAQGAAAGAKIADPFDEMKGNAGFWTHILEGDIHPTADGFQVLAYSFAQARGG